MMLPSPVCLGFWEIQQQQTTLPYDEKARLREERTDPTVVPTLNIVTVSLGTSPLVESCIHYELT